MNRASHHRTVAIIQARLGSTRLPGKVLQDIHGKPMLAHVVDRSRRAKLVDQVVVATTTETADQAIADLCVARGYACFRGDLRDVLDRYYQAAQSYQTNTIVRLTGDCPLIDPGVMDHTIQKFYEAGADFAANRLPPPWGRTYPIGLDVEVCTFQALETAWQKADQPYQREHVMPYLYENEGRFRILLIDHDPDYGHMRWTVDTPEDLTLVRTIFDRFGKDEFFTWEQVLGLFEREPSLAEINAQVRHKTYRESDHQNDG
jgi:spore coat polysaccharide biosynthesis protein SpsF